MAKTKKEKLRSIIEAYPALKDAIEKNPKLANDIESLLGNCLETVGSSTDKLIEKYDVTILN